MKTRAGFWVQVGGYGAASLLALAGVVTALRLAPQLATLVADFAAAILIAIATSSAVIFLSERESRLSSRETQNNLLQSQLEAQQRAVDSLADGLEVALFICDSRAHIVYANHRAAELFDFQDPRGRPVLAVTLSHDLERLLMEAHASKEPQSSELAFSFPKDRLGLVKAWVNPDDPGKVFLSIYDMTDLRRLERVRQDFVANVSHELRTPMTLIRSMAETLLDDAPEGSPPVRYLGKIIEEVDRLSLMSQDLLILSAAESNPVRKHACDLADVFRSTVQQLRMSATQKDLELTYEGENQCLVEANTSQMVQVALNLIQNAINYTNSGSIKVKLTKTPTEALVSVEDTGIGIASEHLSRVFERFYRVDKGRSRNTGGTGLGLSIVKHIVEAHGGRLTVDSALNRGSCFEVRLPVGDQPA